MSSKLPSRNMLQHGRRPIPAALSLLFLLLLWSPASIRGDAIPSQPPAAPPTAAKEKPPKRPFQTKVVRGRVVWLAEALERRYGIQSVADAAHRVLAVETPQGKLRLLLEDARGHAFRVDERLRQMDLKLLVREYESSPVLQVVRVFEVLDGADFEIDYWCQICAIAMYELKACDCCQGPIELRKRRQEVPPTAGAKPPEAEPR